MARSHGDTLSHYRLLEPLGEGGMGEVWKALDQSLDREIAIKFLPPELVDDSSRLARFEHEAKVVAALNHPNIVTVHSVERVNGQRFFTMELLRGRRLSEVIPPKGLPLSDLLEIAIPLVEAVAAAHERNITHGDLKPTNVMLTETGSIKVYDFGLARYEPSSPVRSVSEISTQPFQWDGGISGTLPYMSPEQLEGKGFDNRSDLFSLGIILYEMTTGHRPFDGDTVLAVSAAILRDDPVSVTNLRPELPLHLSWLIGRCLEKDRAQRIQGAGQLLQELQSLQVGGLASPKDEPSIAVLPFADLSQDRDQAYFCEGMSEEIINALTKVEHLHVASRASAFQFKANQLGTREIGQRLGVRTLLEGSVRKVGQRVRISAQLTNVADGYNLWSDQFDRDMKDIFEIQEGIAKAIVDALGVTLTPQDLSEIGRPLTDNPLAYDCYLQGRKFLNQYNRRGIEFARQMFDRAIELDPDFAAGHAGIADCSSFLYTYVDRRPEHLERAERASRKALEIDPQLAEAHASLGATLALSGRHEEAEATYQRALELGPKRFEVNFYYGRELFMMGRLPEAIERFQAAMKLQPEDYQAPFLLGQIYDGLGRNAEGRAMRRRGLNIAEERLRRYPDDIRAMYMAAASMMVLGERERGLEWARKALFLDPEDVMLLYNCGCIFSLAGQADESLDCLEKAARLGSIQREWYANDPDLNPLRELPRFKKLMEWMREVQAK